MMHEPREQRRPARRAVPCVIGIAVIVGVYCLLVPAKPSAVAPVRSVADAPASVAADLGAADINAPPQALRRDGMELRVKNGQPPVIPSWEDGLSAEEVKRRQRAEIRSNGVLPAEWDSVDRAWAEDEVQGGTGAEGYPAVAWGLPASPPPEVTDRQGS